MADLSYKEFECDLLDAINASMHLINQSEDRILLTEKWKNISKHQVDYNYWQCKIRLIYTSFMKFMVLNERSSPA